MSTKQEYLTLRFWKMAADPNWLRDEQRVDIVSKYYSREWGRIVMLIITYLLFKNPKNVLQVVFCSPLHQKEISEASNRMSYAWEMKKVLFNKNYIRRCWSWWNDNTKMCYLESANGDRLLQFFDIRESKCIL